MRLGIVAMLIAVTGGAVGDLPRAAAPRAGCHEQTASEARPAALASAAFERIKALEGQWVGTSTKGWMDRVVFEVIAGGSCVLQRSEFEAHPNETMVTIYHMDRDALVLTHYCVAKNQPRLQATTISPDGRTVEFTFRDATNLASRDQGHMDRAIYRFENDEAFSTQWTWYQQGKERWMEEIKFVRKKSA